MANKKDLACMFPNRATNGYMTDKVTVEADVERGDAVELVSNTAGVKTVKKLTDATKFYGVMVDDTKATLRGDAMTAGMVNVDAITLPVDGSIKPTDLTNAANERLILKQEV